MSEPSMSDMAAPVPKKPKAAQWKRIGSAGFNMCQPLLSDWVSNGELEDPASRRAA